MKPALHILSLPHTQVDKNYVSCAYTQKARKLAIMMQDLGYEVFVYGSEDFDPAIKNPVSVITKKEQERYFGNNDHTKHFYNITWGPQEAHWVHFNNNAIGEINKRIKDKDLILHFAGYCQKAVGDAFPNHMTVEAGIGYTGAYSKYKVYESYAWQNYVHGTVQDDNGEFYETVIPNYWDPSEFPFNKSGDYFLYIGRLIDRKGYHIAQEVCEALGKRLILAGQMDKDQEFTGYGEYVGTVGVEERGELMSKAIAVFTPTTYLGPFEGTHVEAQLCGVPVITTPFGVYNETVRDGFNGMRCYTFSDFKDAVGWSTSLTEQHRKDIQTHAQNTWSMREVAKQYDAYFDRLMGLYDKGWYS